MAVPKRRKSKARRDQRRSHHALAAPARSECPQCHQPKAPHRACRNCGTYRGREVIETEEV
jgi:large subunit ribosomal protein L32